MCRLAVLGLSSQRGEPAAAAAGGRRRQHPRTTSSSSMPYSKHSSSNSSSAAGRRQRGVSGSQEPWQKQSSGSAAWLCRATQCTKLTVGLSQGLEQLIAVHAHHRHPVRRCDELGGRAPAGPVHPPMSRWHTVGQWGTVQLAPEPRQDKLDEVEGRPIALQSPRPLACAFRWLAIGSASWPDRHCTWAPSQCRPSDHSLLQ
jgi:hypothetical protein